MTARRAPRGSDTVLISLRIDPGFHVNANPASKDYLIPTIVAVAGADPERIIYPPGMSFKPAFSEEPIDVYEGTVLISMIFRPGTLDRAAHRKVSVTAQACTEQICLPPADIPAAIE